MMQKQTRREFIGMASLAAASLALGCMSDKPVSRLSGGKDPKDYPVVVIGSGLGGLVAAAYLSKAGFPVTVIEQHVIPGGYATSFQRGNFNFDVSLHFFGLPEEQYNELGLSEKVERIPINIMRRVVGKGVDITSPRQSNEQYLESLYRRFPDSKNEIMGYFSFCTGVMDEIMRFSKKMETSFVFLPFMPFQYSKMWSLRNKSFSELLSKHFKDPNIIKGMILGICATNGLPPSELSAFMGAIMTAFMTESRLYYFKSRSQDLSNGLVSIIEDGKGTVVYSKAVNKIITENDRVTGVKTEDGKIYPAKIVVSNANAPDTFGKFLSDNKNAKKYMEKLSGYQPSISSFVVWLGLKGEMKRKEDSIMIESGYDVETDFKNYFACDAEKAPVAVTIYDNYFKGYSKPGTSTLTIMILCGYEPWARFEKDYFAGNKKEYNKEKMRIANILIKRAEKAIPRLSSMIQVMEAATPLTNITFTRNPRGAIYGYPASVNNSFTSRIKNSTPIEGLYLSSGWGNNPGSYTGGFMNGRNVFRMIMKDL